MGSQTQAATLESKASSPSFNATQVGLTSKQNLFRAGLASQTRVALWPSLRFRARDAKARKACYAMGRLSRAALGVSVLAIFNMPFGNDGLDKPPFGG